jgi:hypothetical protein
MKKREKQDQKQNGNGFALIIKLHKNITVEGGWRGASRKNRNKNVKQKEKRGKEKSKKS